MRIAVLFDNFGPYHVARLNAAAGVAEVLGVEFAAGSGEYGWQRGIGGEAFQRCTLFDAESSRECDTARLQEKLNEALNGFAPEAVAVPGWSGRLAFAGIAWCLRNRVPVVLMSESTAADQRRTAWKELLKRRCVAACGAALVGGARHRDYLVQLGMPPERIFTGYDAVDNAYFSEEAAQVREQAEEHRRRAGLPGRYFLASARFLEKKNLPALLRAFAEYRGATGQKNAPAEAWDLVVLGDGALRAQLEALRDALGLRSSVHLPGFRQYDALPTYYGLASAFIHASAIEQWGLVVNEAMAAGLPLIVSRNCGCADDLVRDGENGFLFDPQDERSLVDLMSRVAAFNEETRRAMALAGQAIISQFGLSQFAEGLLSAAEGAAGAPRKSSFAGAVLVRSLLAVHG